VKDLNYSEPVYIDFENGVRAGVAKEAIEAELFINIPKLKTHFEAGMSVCIKNLMGCLVGQENKKKTHLSLAANILNIGNKVKPHLNIVDALVSMEGLGPTRGIPVKTGIILIGTDPYLIDLMCARIASLDYRKVRTLKEAEKRGLINSNYHSFVNYFHIDKVFIFKPPKAGPLATFVHSPRRQKYFLAVRNTKFFTYLASTKIFGHLLFLSGLRQDNFIDEEMHFEGLVLNRARCIDGCTKCADYCPLGLELPGGLDKEENGCVGCLYCFLVCPTKAISFKGKLGFMAEQLRQYDDISRNVL
jgi:ferredoxin